ERVVDSIYKLIEGKELNWISEYRYQRTDKTYAFVIDKGFAIRDENGKAIRMVGAMQDITEKKHLEDLLSMSNSLARIGSWELNLQKGSLFWSGITKEIHEVPMDYVPELQTAINFYKEGTSRELIDMKVKDAIENETPWDVELQIVTAKGNVRWVRVIGETEFLFGKCVRVYGSFQDINDRKMAEIALLKSLDDKNTILESIGDAFYAVDKDWNVTYWNKEAERMLGISKRMILGKNLWNMFPEFVDSSSYFFYQKAITENSAQHFETHHTTLSAWYEVSVYPSEGGLSVYSKDITERKISEIRLKTLNESLRKQAKELEISNSELEQFAYVASHDLQEPLRMVSSFLAQIEKKYGDVLDQKGKQYIHFAVDGAKRMRQIILDLLNYSRVGRSEEKKEDIDLNQLIKEITYNYSGRSENIKFHIQPLPVVIGQMAPVRQVFQNLIDNAVKYQPEGTQAVIHIACKELPDFWEFSVKDNGIGIENEYFEKVFIIFQRLHTKDEFSGTGMGLAITKKVVESLGGSIWLDSEPGKGSTFYFTLLK
ncbi:MAG: ATP-binding protein, partial [Bacteroidota bacterium]|nr:ATP-binding protein [Bacteroidota bacterium]